MSSPVKSHFGVADMFASRDAPDEGVKNPSSRSGLPGFSSRISFALPFRRSYKLHAIPRGGVPRIPVRFSEGTDSFSLLTLPRELSTMALSFASQVEHVLHSLHNPFLSQPLHRFM